MPCRTAPPRLWDTTHALRSFGHRKRTVQIKRIWSTTGSGQSGVVLPIYLRIRHEMIYVKLDSRILTAEILYTPCVPSCSLKSHRMLADAKSLCINFVYRVKRKGPAE